VAGLDFPDDRLADFGFPDVVLATRAFGSAFGLRLAVAFFGFTPALRLLIELEPANANVFPESGLNTNIMVNYQLALS
ncbi:MAG: hypothetical protein AAGF15_09085, partial [Pseudomonadota bacterium]